MSKARTVSSIALGALSPLGNHTNNTPVVNNNITINNSDSKESTFIEPNPYNEIEKSKY